MITTRRLNRYLSRSYWSIPPCNEPVFSYLAFIRSFSKESACSCLSTNMIDKPSPSSEPRTSNNLRNLPREELWIRNYQSIEFGANKHFWTFLYTFPKTWFHFQNGFSEWAFIFNMWFFFEMSFHFQNVKGFEHVFFPFSKKHNFKHKFVNKNLYSHCK